MASLKIPTIDLQSETIIDDVKGACENYGFFYVTNHQVISMINCFEQSKKFFDLSTEEKLKYACNSNNLGYTSFQDETLSPSDQSCGDTKEGYYIGKDSTSNNIWPSESLLPLWKDTIITYYKECIVLGNMLIQIIAQSLGQSNDYFNDITQDKSAILRLLKYGQIQSDPINGIYGAGQHSDYGLITLLSTNDLPGLEIYLNNTWHPVPPRPGMFIVNIGDSLQILTNGKYKSTIHRVLINTTTSSRVSNTTVTNNDRYSIAFFYEPDFHAVIQPRLTYDDRNPHNSYPSFTNAFYTTPITYGEYLKNKYNMTSNDFKKGNNSNGSNDNKTTNY